MEESQDSASFDLAARKGLLVEVQPPQPLSHKITVVYEILTLGVSVQIGMGQILRVSLIDSDVAVSYTAEEGANPSVPTIYATVAQIA